ncbi:MAG TPA: hypothetical protein VFY82_16015 [Acidimicrobiales bacterium]|nr:hypothetical protein [Acidimicrobiales bacterium]
MRARALAATAAVCITATTWVTGAPAWAQADPPPVEVLPTSGPPGSIVTVTGAGCDSPAQAGAELWDAVAGGSVDVAFADVAADGIWTVDLAVPEDRTPGEMLEVRSWCELGPGDNWDYAQGEFEVTDPRPTVLPLSVTPTSGPVGTTISVSGTDCAGDEVEFALLAGTGIDDITAIVDAWSMEPADDGSWSGELLVYDTMIPAMGDGAEIDVVPGGDYFVAAACVFYPTDVPEAPSPDEIIFSDTVGFDITGDGTAPRSDPPPATEIVPAQAQPATPVAGNPSYTG